MQPFLSLSGVSYTYHSTKEETQALKDISFTIKEGEFVSILGPSGCGKSTLLSLLADLIEPEEGSIIFEGKTCKEAKGRIGYMLQKDHLFPWRSVFENAILGLEIQKQDTKERRDNVKALLRQYGLEDFMDAKPNQLSGGMRQRVALIRTLALNPTLLLLDEPFSALDYQTRLQVSDDIAKIIRDTHKTAILVTHDISEAISLGDRVIVLSKAPATVKKIIPIRFDLPERSNMTVRNTKEFQDYFNLIWKELNDYE